MTIQRIRAGWWGAAAVTVASGLSSASPPPSKVSDARQPERAEGTHGARPAPTARSPSRGSAAGLVPFVRITQVNVDGDGLNIVGDAANEPSIAVDPNDRLKMAVGWRQFDTVNNSFREAGVAWSDDGGESWTVLEPLQAGVFRSDPVLLSDDDGTFYYNSLLGGGFTTWVFRSFDGGKTWSEPAFAFGGDKQWMAVDRTAGPSRGALYQAWNVAGNNYFPATFNRSLDGGQNWTQPVEIPGRPIFGTVATGPNGEVFVAGASGSAGGPIVVTRALNGGSPGQAPVFESATPVGLGGPLLLGAFVNPEGLGGQAIVEVDRSSGLTRGSVYVLASVDPPGADPADLMFARSTDGGASWHPAVRLNDDAPGSGAYQWFGTMSVAPNGRIDVVWNDTRDGAGAQFSAIYYAFSVDGGVTFSPNYRLTSQYDSRIGWPQQAKIGDYWGMVSDELGADLACAATWNGEQDVYHLRITAPVCPAGGRDCNGNGFEDECEAALGFAPDFNGNGLPDECESARCLADTDRDGLVAFGDISAVLGSWNGTGARGFVGDASGDGRADATDLAVVLQRWLETCP